MKDLVVAKFGGTSMGGFEAMLKSAQIVKKNPQVKLVVVSATSGTTNQLLELYKACIDQKLGEAEQIFSKLQEKHLTIATQLKLKSDDQKSIHELFEEINTLRSQFTQGKSLAEGMKTQLLDQLLSTGERLSSLLFSQALGSQGCPSSVFDVRKVMITDEHFGKAEAAIERIAEKCRQELLPLLNDQKVWVTQGFVGATPDGKTTTLGRGGSDYSAALLAEGLEASEVQIWTDVPGIFTMDPNLVPNAKAIPSISFDEAAELANFGAKVLHPATLWPAIRKRIRTFVGSTFHPDSSGTRIFPELEESPSIRAIAIRKHQTLITVSSLSMLNAPGFLAKLFETLAKYRLSIDLVTTSEVSVALTIDVPSLGSSGKSILQNEDMFNELRTFCTVTVEEGLSLIAIIGNRLTHTSGISARAFKTISGHNVRLICHGASSHNLCFLVGQDEAASVAKELHREFIEQKTG